MDCASDECWQLCGYAGTFGGLGGGMPEPLRAQGGVCRNS